MKVFLKFAGVFCILLTQQLKAAEMKKSLQIMPGKIHENCFTLASNKTINYTFTTSSAVAFNIHYHLGQQVKYPIKINSISKKSGVFKATLKQDYCLMWTNNGNQSINLKYSYQIK